MINVLWLLTIFTLCEAQEVIVTNDPGSFISPRPVTNLALPPIRDLRIRRIPYEQPNLEHFRSSLGRHDEAIEFIVELEPGEVATRAYGPALFVGDVEIRHSERLGKTTWRFLEFELNRLEAGAAISWGWMKDPPESRQRTPFRYELTER